MLLVWARFRAALVATSGYRAVALFPGVLIALSDIGR
jgi:hypothetical protein